MVTDIPVCERCGGAKVVAKADVRHEDLRAHNMSLRDYFAAKAMQAMVSTYTDMVRFEETPEQAEKRQTTFYREMAIDHNLKTSHDDGCEEIAADAYRVADAMLAAREKST